MKCLTPVNNQNLQMYVSYQLYCKQMKRELFCRHYNVENVYYIYGFVVITITTGKNYI